MQDCVIGCFSGYGWDDVRVWAQSLAASGFSGRKVALTRAPPESVTQALVALGFDVLDFVQFPAAGAPHVERFANLRRYLFSRRQQGQTFRWVIATDVRDVVFQRIPINYLRHFEPPRLVLSPEGMLYAHAEWNAANLVEAFGAEALQMLLQTPPSNVGVLAGGHRAIEGLALLIEQLARVVPDGVADQAALNLLIEGMGDALAVHGAGPAEPWACQAGVMADPTRIERNRPHLLGPEPVFRDGWVLTASGEPYAIVHQYDRVPDWHAAIRARFPG